LEDEHGEVCASAPPDPNPSMFSFCMLTMVVSIAFFAHYL
jgi:hypothetical protein